MTTRTEHYRIWVEQCRAARHIKSRFGEAAALGYLVGEKLPNHLCEATRSPEFADEVPRFVAEIKRMFAPAPLKAYLVGARRVGFDGAQVTAAHLRALLL